MATRIIYETTCDICESTKSTADDTQTEYGLCEFTIRNLPLTKELGELARENAVLGGEIEQDEHGQYFGSYTRSAAVCSVSCARRLLIHLTNSLPVSAIPPAEPNPRIGK